MASMSPEPATEAALRAADGRRPGRRGMATRQRLIECTRDMLRSTSYRDLKVVDIAREAGTSPATFYQYFPDVESAVFALAEEMTQHQRGRFADIVRNTTWKGRQGYEGALALASEFLRFWQDYHPILKVVDLASAEGDPRFRALRTEMLNDLTNALTDEITAMKADGRLPDEVDPPASAGVLVAMLAQVASHRHGLEHWGAKRDDLRVVMARIVYWSITGQKPPSAVG